MFLVLHITMMYSQSQLQSYTSLSFAHPFFALYYYRARMQLAFYCLRSLEHTQRDRADTPPKSLMQTKSLLSLPDRKHITQTDKIIWQSLIHFDINVIIQQHVHICLYTRYIYKGIAIRRTSQMCVYVCTCGCMHPCEHMYVHVHICISYGYLSMHIIWILKYCINECL